MSRQEYEAEAEAIRRAAETVLASSDSVRRFLVEAGIVTPAGDLAEAYR